MHLLITFTLSSIAIIVIFFHVTRLVRDATLTLKDHGFSYEHKIIEAHISYNNIRSIKIKKSPFGNKIILNGKFKIKIKNFGQQPRSNLEIHESKNFDIDDAFSVIFNHTNKMTNEIQKQDL